MSWEKVKLDRFFIVKKGQAITKKESNPGIYPVILGGREPAYYIDKYNHTGKAIVVSRSGASAGYVSFWNEPIFITDGFLIEPKDDVVYIFVYYLLKYKQSQLIGNQRGAAIPHVTPNLLYSVEAFCPPLATQQKIADILSAYDNLIENNQQQIKLLEEAAQRLYKQWFIDLRYPGHETTKIVDGLPEGWRKCRIDERFKTVLGGTPSRANPNYWNGNIAWINSGEVNNLRIMKASEYITELALEKSATKMMPLHTTVLAITGATLGQVSYTEIETCANQSVVGIIDETELFSMYLYLFVSTNIKSMIGKATGGAQQHINKDIVNEYKIVLPEECVIKKMNILASPLFNKIADCYRQIEKLTESRDRLLPRLMNGELCL